MRKYEIRRITETTKGLRCKRLKFLSIHPPGDGNATLSLALVAELADSGHVIQDLRQLQLRVVHEVESELLREARRKTCRVKTENRILAVVT